MTRREQEIVTAAAQVFKDKGYHAATTRDIAAAVGIQQASLYYYVSSKEELLYLVVRQPIMQLYAQVEEIVKANVPVRYKIERCLQVHLAAFDDNYPHMFVFVQELPNVVQALQDKLHDLPRRYQRLWEDIVRQGMTTGELRTDLDVATTTLMMLGMCNWMYRWYRKGGRLDTAALARQYASAILDGIVPRAVSD
ncbi:MAG TPA: TetR/AcrR family transcriptional regulator [Candidatus Tectomicrobia bacterium]|jgi:AcrR family transcriptional regulator